LSLDIEAVSPMREFNGVRTNETQLTKKYIFHLPWTGKFSLNPSDRLVPQSHIQSHLDIYLQVKFCISNSPEGAAYKPYPVIGLQHYVAEKHLYGASKKASSHPEATQT